MNTRFILTLAALLCITALSSSSRADQLGTSEALLVKDVFQSAGLLGSSGYSNEFVRLDDVACAFSHVDHLPNGIEVSDSPVCAGFKGTEEIVITGFDASTLGGLIERHGRKKNIAGTNVAVAFSVELRVDGFSSKVDVSID